MLKDSDDPMVKTVQPSVKNDRKWKVAEAIDEAKECLKMKEDTNKKTDPDLLKLEAEITILTYPPDWIHIYTDGSAFKATVNAGYGVYACFPDGTSKEIYGACGETCSDYEAETIGIQSALELLNTTLNKNPTAKKKCSDFLRLPISTPGAARRNDKRH
ncbi:hypothetical protein ElyMa_003775300 [Elysia marginata]|uniref:RNase H type-1 domain-containing protein n=1 Tax=Elysia marginata TaxID=1093978 RepID=A0AAV4F9L0_9GAST|nr:hypothetical protein ElyMa_003775300 [Elysia marginata]